MGDKRSRVEAEVRVLAQLSPGEAIQNEVAHGKPPTIRAANAKASTIKQLDLRNKFHFRHWTKPRNLVQPYYFHKPGAGGGGKDDDSIDSIDLVYANVDANNLEQPTYILSKEMIAKSNRKKRPPTVLSPLVPQGLTPSQMHRVKHVIRYKHLENKARTLDVSPVSLRRGTTPEAKGRIKTTWNKPEYVQSPNLFYKCASPERFYRGRVDNCTVEHILLDRSPLSVLRSDRPTTSHAAYNEAAKALKATVAKRALTNKGKSTLSAYFESGVVKATIIDPNAEGGGESKRAKLLELSILRHISMRERCLRILRQLIKTSQMTSSGTFKDENLIKRAKQQLRPKQLARACDNIRAATVKVIIEVDSWRRVCSLGLRKDRNMPFACGQDTNTIPPENSVSNPRGDLEMGNQASLSNISSGFHYDDGLQQVLDSNLPRLSLNREFEVNTPYFYTPSSGESSVFSRIQSPPRPFLYKGENYMHKMFHDVSFLDEEYCVNNRSVTSVLGLHAARENPLLYTANLETLSGNSSVAMILSANRLEEKEFRNVEMMLYRESASILLEEYGYLKEIAHRLHQQWHVKQDDSSKELSLASPMRMEQKQMLAEAYLKFHHLEIEKLSLLMDSELEQKLTRRV
jgi:hypothetical protein